MALKKFLFMNGSYGYQEEQGSADGLKLPSLVIGAGSESAGNISLSTTGKIVDLANGTAAGDAVNKGQLDAAIAGYEWKQPVSVLKIKSDATQAGSPPTAGAAGEAWVVDTWGGGYNDGDIVEWDGSQWNIVVANSGGEPPDGTRAIVIDTSAAGSFAGQENKIGTYDATGDSWSFVAPSDGDAVLVAGENGIYENIGFVYDTGTGWVAFTGPTSIPDATSASGGGIKGKVTFDADYGLSVTAGVAKIDIVAAGSGTGGLEFSGGDLQLDVNAAGGLELTSSGLGANVDGTTIDINGSNELYVKNVVESNRTGKSYTAGEALTAGDPVYFSANDTPSQADAAVEAESRVVGVSLTTGSGTVNICFAGLAPGVLSGATFNTPYYLASGGGLTTTRPTGNVRIIRIGYAVNATDLLVNIVDFGRAVA